MPTEQSSTTCQSARGRFTGRVEINRPMCTEHHLLRIRVDGAFPATTPGQFIQIGCRPPQSVLDGGGLAGHEFEWTPGGPVTVESPESQRRLALLRRPFSLSGRGDDERGTWLEIIHRVVGTGTAWLSELSVGDPVDLIGPLGNAFRLPPDKCVGLMVGGGVGLPPMFYLAERLRAEGWNGVAFMGALRADLIAADFVEGNEPDAEGLPVYSVQQFAAHDYPAVVTTDDGSLGLTGRITDGLERTIAHLPEDTRARAVVFTCGPEPMMKAVADLAAASGIDCQVCLEQAMACGMGTCQSCVVKIDPESVGMPAQAQTEDGRPWRYQLACTDGPVFDAKQVVW